MPASIANTHWRASMRALAEASAAHAPLAAGEQLIDRGAYLLFFGNADHAGANGVQRLRLAADGVPAAVAEVRALARQRGRRALTWEIADAAEPADLGQRLLALGLQDAVPPGAVVMGRAAPLPAGAPDIVVQQVDTVDDFKAHVSVTHAAFDALAHLPAELARIDRDGERDIAQRAFVRYNALIDGRVVGAATATYTPAGAMIHSGSTLIDYRGRGVYQALVARRWQDAVARGTPALVTRAGVMSKPILARLGFEELGRIRFLVDAL
jgi:hypothetical protein